MRAIKASEDVDRARAGSPHARPLASCVCSGTRAGVRGCGCWLRGNRFETLDREDQTARSRSGASRALRPRTIMAGGGLLRGATTLGGLLPLGGKRELKRPRRVREVVVVRRGSSSRPEPLGTQKLTRRINATALFDEQRSNSRTCKRSSRRLLVTQARPTMPRGRTRIRPRPGRPHGRTIVGKEWFPCSGRRPRR